MLYEPPQIIERCVTPRGEIQLQKRDSDYEIISNGTFLMATYNGQSEKLLMKAALDACDIQQCSVLIGGLGVGYTLAEALNQPRVEKVTVVEIEDKIIEWNRSYLADFSGNALMNVKTKIVHADLIEWVNKTQLTFDIICLDIDNGPDWTVFEENNHLYNDQGLAALASLLNPHGVVSFWSASSSPVFMQRLNVHFSDVRELYMKLHQDMESDIVYIAKKGGDTNRNG